MLTRPGSRAQSAWRLVRDASIEPGSSTGESIRALLLPTRLIHSLVGERGRGIRAARVPTMVAIT